MCVSERVIESTDLGHVFAGFPCVQAFFAVAASCAGEASPASGTTGCGFNKRIVCRDAASPTKPFQPTASNCACIFTAIWVGGKKSASQALGAEFQNFTRQGLDHSPCTTFCPRTPLMFLLSIQVSFHGPTDQFLEL